MQEKYYFFRIIEKTEKEYLHISKFFFYLCAQNIVARDIYVVYIG